MRGEERFTDMVREKARTSVLGYAILELLERADLSGYELKRRFESSLGFAWHAHDSQIYPELRRLEARGLVRSTWVNSMSRRRQRLYSITDLGRQHLLAWLHSPLKEFHKQKDELKLRIWSYNLLSPEALESFLNHAEAQYRQALELYLDIRTRLVERHGGIETASPKVVGPLLCLEQDIRTHQACLEWIAWVRQALARRKGL